MAAFLRPKQTYLPVIDDDTYSYQKVNVAAQEADPDSILNRTRHLIRTRQSQAALRAGEFAWVESGSKETIAFKRSEGDSDVLCLFNLTGESQTALLDLTSDMLDLLVKDISVVKAGSKYKLAPFAAHWLVPNF